ncbi:MAG: hypothetical protein D6782_06265, partial [Alphaproteobacteria bacterium]
MEHSSAAGRTDRQHTAAEGKAASQQPASEGGARSAHAAARAPFWVVEGGAKTANGRLERSRMRDFARASSDWFWEMDAASR